MFRNEYFTANKVTILSMGISDMETVKFYFWVDQKDDYCAQLTEVTRLYFKTKIDQPTLAEQYPANLVDSEITMHLYTHILMLAQQWRNQIYTFLQDNLKRQQLPSQNLNYRTVVRLFSMLLSADVAKTMNVAEMQQLYYLAETIKSGNERAVQKLQQLRPDFFRSQADPLDFSGNSLSSHLDVFTSVYTNQAALLINELDLLNFERSAQTFWQQIPETLAIEQESLLALLG